MKASHSLPLVFCRRMVIKWLPYDTAAPQNRLKLVMRCQSTSKSSR